MPGTASAWKAAVGVVAACWLPQHSGQWLAARWAGPLPVLPPTLQMAMAGASRAVRAIACCHQGAATMVNTNDRQAHAASQGRRDAADAVNGEGREDMGCDYNNG